MPRPMDLLYIRQCTQCSFSVEGKVAKCIIGTPRAPPPPHICASLPCLFLAEGAETVSVDFKEPIMSGTLVSHCSFLTPAHPTPHPITPSHHHTLTPSHPHCRS